MASTSSPSDYNYVTEPDDAYKCLICLDVARDPMQHEECGKLFCKECLEEYGKNKPCPICKTGSQYYKDNKTSKNRHGFETFFLLVSLCCI